MKIVLKKEYLLYFLLLLSFANASIRFDASGYTTFYRLFSPLLFLLLLFRERKILLKPVCMFIFVLLYSVAVSLFFYDHIAYTYHIILIYVFIVYTFIYTLRMHNANFDESFFSFLNKTTIIILLLSIFQMMYHVPYPFLNISPKPLVVNVFFSNENELCEPLACMAVIYFVRNFIKRENKHMLKILIIFVLMIIDDAKLSLIGTLIGFLLASNFIDIHWRKSTSRLGGGSKLFIAFFVVIACIGALSIFEVVLPFPNYPLTIDDLLLTHIRKILTLDSYESGGGSLIDRTNAIIYGLIELKKTWFFGIGFGNSVYVLDMPQYMLLTAQSMHNIFFQIICEFGYIAIITYFLIGKSVFVNLKNNASWQNILKFTYCFAFIFISSQSSIGILSNYMTWAVTFYVTLIGDNDNIGTKDTV